MADAECGVRGAECGVRGAGAERGVRGLPAIARASERRRDAIMVLLQSAW